MNTSAKGICDCPCVKCKSWKRHRFDEHLVPSLHKNWRRYHEH
jgi:hypothetical protein